MTKMLDPKAPDSQIRITDFAGMSPGTDQHDNDPGTSYYQVNVVPFYPGELRARRGFVVVRFEEGSDSPDLVAPPTTRYAEASSSVLVHPGSRAGRDLEARAFSAFDLSSMSDAGKKMTETIIVLTAEADVLLQASPQSVSSRILITPEASSILDDSTGIIIRGIAGNTIIVSASGQGSVTPEDVEGFSLLEML